MHHRLACDIWCYRNVFRLIDRLCHSSATSTTLVTTDKTRSHLESLHFFRDSMELLHWKETTNLMYTSDETMLVCETEPEEAIFTF